MIEGPSKGLALAIGGVIVYSGTAPGVDRLGYRVCDTAGRCTTGSVTIKRS